MISVAMATYNGEAFIEEQLSSILNQSFLVDEIIICDDCSTDNTLNIIERIIRENSLNINLKVISNNKNIGYIDNFYKAISLTRGEYIFLADQDDIWEFNKVEKYMELMEKYDLVCSQFQLIDSSGCLIQNMEDFKINRLLKKNNKNISEISIFKLAFGNIAPGCTYCISKEIKDIYLKLKNKEVIHDYQLMLIGAVYGKVGLYSTSLIKYRLHENNSVGFVKKDRKISLRFRKIRKTPIMADFFHQLNKIHKIHFCFLYELLYYLRIPYIKAKLKRAILG
ncbi:glycosyltransferase family 2 protein [Clostridium butyricum]|uniref:glycosyltransferase family 2 protein n=1 Tax=Clostridium butyricum TaxID=1492 RepID=UPI000F53870E|nr:glycosyltransferase family 2 protein [Clostridium butyricum]RQN02447.1 glycosyltransferase family 2 protein [Clostridium butyricum]